VVLWQIELDEVDEVVSVDVRRALVRSRHQLDYAGLQRAVDDGSMPEAVRLLAQVGQLRLALGRKRHAIDLDLPEQQITGDSNSGWTLTVGRFPWRHTTRRSHCSPASAPRL
jgi:exoribonuclease R